MVERTNFFVASLWASLVPVGMLALTCAGLMVLPITGDFVEPGRKVAGLALILVPFAYTGLVVTTYGVGRLLYALRVLNRVVLFCAYGVLALAGAAIFSKVSASLGFTAGASVRAFLIVLGYGLVALMCACWVWWRVASRPSPDAVQEVRREHRRRRRQERRAQEDRQELGTREKDGG